MAMAWYNRSMQKTSTDRKTKRENPFLFQGDLQRKGYFEGWYFKCISADRKHAIAVIPGMAVDPQGHKHAFIQVINAVSGKTWYFHFPYDAFSSPNDHFAVRIGQNTFSSDNLTLDIASSEGTVRGQLIFSDIHHFPTGRHSPGIMGPFTNIPFMECYHGVVSPSNAMNASLNSSACYLILA